MTYGIDSTYDYSEFQLDSLDNSGANNAGVSPINWPKFLLGGIQMSNIAALKIVAAEIPFSYYVFNQYNNTFILKEDGGADTLVTLRVGNYTLTQLLLEISTAMSAVSPSGTTYTATYNGQTMKMTLTATMTTILGFSLTFGLISNSGNTNPRLYIGFPGGVTTSSGLVLVTPNALLLSGANYVYLNSQKFGQLSNSFLPEGASNLGGGTKGAQMAKIPVNVSPGEIINYSCPIPDFWFYVGNLNTLQNIDFYLTLGNSSLPTPLDLNGLGFSLKLGILTHKLDQMDTQSGSAEQGRAQKRIRPY